MASYASYKKIVTEQIIDGTLSKSTIPNGVGPDYNVLHVYGSPCVCSNGCCCLWTVPSGVKRVTFELWGAGGNGNGACNCNRCQHYQGAQGGYYNSKTIFTVGGCQYTICAGGHFPCCQFDCNGCQGCPSFVTGYNLTNFCALGGLGGIGDASWQSGCYSSFPCCLGPNNFDGDFGMGNHAGAFGSSSIYCHCVHKDFCSTGAPFLGSASHGQLNFCSIRCGCWMVPYGTGGQSAMTSCCGSGVCGQGGMGGPGLVKITYF
jgi:hypothetical protein